MTYLHQKYRATCTICFQRTLKPGTSLIIRFCPGRTKRQKKCLSVVNLMPYSESVKAALANTEKLYEALLEGRHLDVSKVSSDPSEPRFRGLSLLKKDYNFSKTKTKHLLTYPEELNDGSESYRRQILVSSNLKGVSEFASSIAEAYEVLNEEQKTDEALFNSHRVNLRWLVNPEFYGWLNEQVVRSAVFFEEQFPTADREYVKREPGVRKPKEHKGRKPRYDASGKLKKSEAQKRQEMYEASWRQINLADPNHLTQGNFYTNIVSPRAKAAALAARKSPVSRSPTSPLSSGRSTPRSSPRSTPISSPRSAAPSSPQRPIGSPRRIPNTMVSSYQPSLAAPRSPIASPRSASLSRAPLSSSQIPAGNLGNLL